MMISCYIELREGDNREVRKYYVAQGVEGMVLFRMACYINKLKEMEVNWSFLCIEYVEDTDHLGCTLA